MSSYRIVVCFDIEAPTAADAYARLYEMMKIVDRPSFTWESTDEWYDPDGEPLREVDCVEARTAVLEGYNGQ